MHRLRDLLELGPDVQVEILKGVWVAARPEPEPYLRHRLRDAWAVLTGRGGNFVRFAHYRCYLIAVGVFMLRDFPGVRFWLRGTAKLVWRAASTVEGKETP